MTAATRMASTIGGERVQHLDQAQHSSLTPPPQYPATMPSTALSAAVTSTATVESSSVVAMPSKIRGSSERPRLSVPRR